MTALGGSFLPGAYHFLRSDTDPAEQARHFHQAAGDMSGFAVALDVEPASGSRPSAAQARVWVDEYQRLSGHPVIGYYPRWYWQESGQPDLSFFDSVWQSRYVSGAGSPSALYAGVPAGWWEPFGGEPISILQFSSSATVPGITGRCDVNAFRGSLTELRTLALGDTMAITDADAEKIARKVLELDGVIQAGDDNTKNPYWTLKFNVYDINKRVRAVQSAVGKLAAQQPVDVDEDAIVAGVLAGLGPDGLAQRIADYLGPDMARKVADELHNRLGA
jgi:GH25 family lysozyme M1 (1,4-beta-N-acetylmuramidase)